MQIIYFIDNKLGGISSFNYNIISNKTVAGTRQTVIHLDQLESTMTRANMSFGADREIHFNYSGKENAYQTIKNLATLVPKEKGVFVLNDNLEMEMLDHFQFPQTVFQVVHDQYNLLLAEKYEHVVDVFIAHSRFFFDKLKESIPHRIKDIYYLPHGVPVPLFSRIPDAAARPLKLLFLGRMNAAKGIFDLPVISKMLDTAGIKYEWVCIGNGAEREQLMEQWDADIKPRFMAPSTSEEVIRTCSEQDVFVLPTKFEGSPVSLIETMSVGLVPVISDLPGGIREIVTADIGFRPLVDNNEAFAESIIKLYHDRNLLNTLSVNSRKKIEANYNVKQTAAAYHELFSRYESLYKPKTLKKIKIGARLDHPLIPSFITKAIRNTKS